MTRFDFSLLKDIMTPAEASEQNTEDEKRITKKDSRLSKQVNLKILRDILKIYGFIRSR